MKALLRACGLLAFNFVILTSTAIGGAQSFSIEQVMSAPFASLLTAAPSGAKVAWLMNERGQRNVWIAAAPDWKGRKVTAFNQDDGQDIDELAWSPDGSYLLFARGGDFENGEDNPNPALSTSKPEQAIWIVALDGSPAKKLTEGHAPAVSPKGGLIAFLRGGQIFTTSPKGEHITEAVIQKWPMQDLRWSPDGAHLAFVSDRRDHSFIGVYTPADKTLRYLDASVDRDISPVWSPDGARLAYLRIPARAREQSFGPHREGEPWSIRITDLTTGSARQIFQAEAGPGSVFHPIVARDQIFWADGNHIVFPWEQTGWCHLYSLPSEPRPLGSGPAELTPGEGEVEHVAISANRKTIFYSSNISDIDRRHLWSVNPSGHASPQLVTRGENIEWSPTPLAEGSSLAFLESSYNQKAHAALRLSDGKMLALAPDATPAEFPSASLVKPLPVLITAADGLQIHGQLFLPPSAPDRSGRHPALIFFHGGSRREMLLGFHYMYYYSNAYSLNEYFANHGYVVLSVNYRSGIGYGLNFREAINYGMTGASEFNDVIGAGLYLKSRSDVDPQRIGVWGGSYGGYLTALALARASDLFAAGVDFHGVHDWSELEPSTGPPSDPTVAVNAAKLAFDSSPMASVKTWRSPVLLIHGDDDRNVAFSQTVELVEALRKQHVEFEELIIPNEIHDFLMYQHWVQAYQAAADFFARKLGAGEEAAVARHNH
ncbi:MAG TPA: prolyl oligopeptidase family serine peptidase [Bryobacteraceae bacterium]|nr:prolyl oligopeptidase family serine peptidase [Bryobacteraceae bacterium]